MNKAYDKVTWQNTPNLATPLNATNLNKMSDALDTIDDRVIALDANKANASDVATALNGKVDKVEGYGLSENDYTTAEKTKLAGISAQANKVEITPVVTEGTTLATISIDGVDTAIKGSDIDVDDEISPTSENPVQNKVITAKINEIEESKADKNGEITSAKASYSLLCDTPINDNEPYTYRQFPVANAKLEKLKKLIGASVVWNQLVSLAGISDGTSQNVRFDVDGNEVKTSNTATGNATFVASSYIDFYANHIYLLKGSPSGGSNSAHRLDIRFNDSTAVTKFDYGNGAINKVTEDKRGRVNIRIATGINANGLVFKPQVIDLTAMFGSTIADYINTLETTTEGSGKAWLQKYGFFTEEYYAYSENTIQSVSVSGHKVVGKNRCNNATIDVGHYYNGSGVYTASAENAGSDLIQVSPQFTYYTSIYNKTTKARVNNLVVTEWTKDNSFIQQVAVSGTYTPSAQCRFIRLRNYNTDSGLITANNFLYQIELGSTATAYEPYTSQTTALDHTTLRGLFKLDANNNLYADGDVYNADGSGSVKYEIVDLGDLNWTLYSGDNTNHSFVVAIPSDAKATSSDSDLPKLLTENYITDLFGGVSVWKTKNKAICQVTNAQRWIIRDENYSTANDFITAVTGQKLQYELATSTTAELTPFNPLSVIEQGGTEEFADYGVEQGNRDMAIPCGTDTDFYQGLSLPTVPTTDGTYVLKATVSSGTATLSWVAE